MSSIPIIFIHGIKGSTIVDQYGGTHYINFWQGIGLSSPKLSLPLTWQGDKQDRDELRAGKILDKIAHVQVYGTFLNYLHTLGRPVYQFAYDWRRDLNETAEIFQSFIREIYTKHNSKVQLIAHSMGGLVTLAAINTHHGVLVGTPFEEISDKDNFKPKSGDDETVDTPNDVTPSDDVSNRVTGSKGDERVIDIVQSVLFAGCPFRTGVGFLRDLMIGTPNGYNHKILSPAVLFTFPSIFTFFPKKENSQILDERGEPIPIDFYEAKDWVDYKLGIFDSLRNPTEQHLNHLLNCTKQAKFFRSKIVALKDVKYPPCAVLSSHKHVTERRYTLINGNLDFGTPITGMGDNRIINATPPDGIPYKEYETDESHAGLLNDLAISDQIIKGLLESTN